MISPVQTDRARADFNAAPSAARNEWDARPEDEGSPHANAGGSRLFPSLSKSLPSPTNGSKKAGMPDRPPPARHGRRGGGGGEAAVEAHGARSPTQQASRKTKPRRDTGNNGRRGGKGNKVHFADHEGKELCHHNGEPLFPWLAPTCSGGIIKSQDNQEIARVEVCGGCLLHRFGEIGRKGTDRGKRGSRGKRASSGRGGKVEDVERKPWKRRWMSLHAAHLFAFEKESTWGLPPVDILDLRPGVLQVAEVGTEDCDRRFNIITKFGIHQFQAASPQVMQAWLNSLRTAMRLLQQRDVDGKPVVFKEVEFGAGALGLHLAVRNGRIVVENRAPNSAASRRDINIGDVISAANGVPMQYSLTGFRTELQFLKNAPRPLRILLEREVPETEVVQQPREHLI